MKAFIMIVLLAASGCVSMEGLRQGAPVPGSEKDGKPSPSSRLAFNGVGGPGDAITLTALDNERILIEGQVANERALIERGFLYPSAMGGPAAAYMGYGMQGPAPAATSAPQGTAKDAEQDKEIGKAKKAAKQALEQVAKTLPDNGEAPAPKPASPAPGASKPIPGVDD